MSNINYILIDKLTQFQGNERDDSAAISALDLIPDKFQISYTYLKPKINRFLNTTWQQHWNNNIYNKLFSIKPTLGGWRQTLRKSRKEQVIVFRLRIGHTRLTHSYTLKQEQQPQCGTCQTPLTVKHLFMECRFFAHIRNRYFKANNMKDLFENFFEGNRIIP